MRKKNNSKFENLEFTSSKLKNLPVKRKLYFNLETRLILSIIIVIFLLIITGLTMYKIYALINKSGNEKELGSVTYKVCDNSNNCNSNININKVEDIKNIKAYFNYNYYSSINRKYNITYWIDYSVSINTYDEDNNLKELFNKSEKLVYKNDISLINNKFSIDKEINIDMEDFYYIVNNYIKTHKLKDNYSKVSFDFYLKNDGIISKISSLELEFEGDEVLISTNNLNDDVLVNDEDINNYMIILTIICMTSIVITFLLIIRITNIIVRTMDNNSKYYKKITEILEDYKEDIIIARKEYDYKDVTKVYTFDELLLLKKKLDKKIRFYRINNIKCVFIIEDNDKVYQYSIKDLK